MQRLRLISLVLIVLCGFSMAVHHHPDSDHCTSIIVGPKASVHGAMTTHTSDCANCDFRLSKISARNWPAGTMRPLYLLRNNYPGTISRVRGDAWLPENLEGTPAQLLAWGNESVITGYIPQAAHTFALFEGRYGIINEHQVAIGESTCPAKLWAAPITAGGQARIEAKEMTVIALERSKTAREAIQIMGDLATSLGFYSAEWQGGDDALGEGGEALTVIDKHEAWVFHVLADDSGTSAVWVAQRVPDDHVAAVANQFIIRHVIPGHPDFMYSSNLWEVAERNGFWSPKDGLLDFLSTYAPMRLHPIYSTRRVWRVLDVLAPSLKLPANTDPYANDYPFSVKLEGRLLTAQDLMALQRDHYEGSQFDLTQGLAAGPYGDPNRFDATAVDGLSHSQVIEGAYERSISLFRTSYSFVAMSRVAVPDELAMMWFAPHAPSGSSYAPFYVQSVVVPLQYKRGSLFKYDDKVAFWNFLAVANYAARFYKYAMQDVRKVQDQLMAQSLAAVAKAEAMVLALLSQKNDEEQDKTAVAAKVQEVLTTTVQEQAALVVSRWRALLFEVITRFHDGYVAENLSEPDIDVRKLFYPKSWLEATGYFKNLPNYQPGSILFAQREKNCQPDVFKACFWTAAVVCLLTIAACSWVNRYKFQATVNTGPGVYMPIDQL